MEKRKIAITIIAFIIIEGISFLMIDNSHNKEINEYFKKNTLEIEVKYKAVPNTYTLMTETILTQFINKPKILKLYSNAYQANNYQKQLIRDSLYNGFRYVFPLFCENKHIGSVETSFSFNAIVRTIKTA